jgi:hypothetical protein
MKRVLAIVIADKLLQLIAVALFLYFLTEADPVQADVSADTVKAAFIYQFGKYVKWPEETSAEFTICADSNSSATKELIKYQGRKVHSLPVAVTEFNPKTLDQLLPAKKCQLVYVEECSGACEKALQGNKGNPTLTVTDNSDVSMIRLLVGEKIKFIISRSILESSKLSAQSELLRIAAEVR